MPSIYVMTRALAAALTLFASLLLSSCVVVRAPQVERLYAAVTEAPDPVASYTYDLFVGSYQTDVLLVDLRKTSKTSKTSQTGKAQRASGYIWVNEAGDALKFDGLFITDIQQLATVTNASPKITQQCEPWQWKAPNAVQELSETPAQLLAQRFRVARIEFLSCSQHNHVLVYDIDRQFIGIRQWLPQLNQPLWLVRRSL